MLPYVLAFQAFSDRQTTDTISSEKLTSAQVSQKHYQYTLYLGHFANFVTHEETKSTLIPDYIYDNFLYLKKIIKFIYKYLDVIIFP